MSITFRADPDAHSRAVIDYRHDCDVEPRHDRRRFANYEAAVAGLGDHALHCTFDR